MQVKHISVCICTFQRPHLLKRLLLELGRQETEGEFTYSIVVADNDHRQSAKPVVEEMRKAVPVPIDYSVEPHQNIALARNKAIENATGDYVAFIDDDEFPATNWLLKLSQACGEHRVDGALGPVKPFFEQAPPRWLVRGRFCERPEYPTGTVVCWREGRTGNVLYRKRILVGIGEPFRRQFGSGSENTDFFRRMVDEGHVFTWCNEAVVYETVPPERWKRCYLLKRALLRGQNQRHLAGFRSIAKSVIAIPIYAILLPFLLLLGQHVCMRYLIKLSDHAGKLLAFLCLKPLGDKYITG